jgi:hypothetical protein
MSNSDFLLVVSILILAWQTFLLRKQFQQQSARGNYDYWIKAAEFQVEFPDFHRAVVSASVLQTLEQLSEAELRLRAMTWLVFDVFNALDTETKPDLIERIETKVQQIFIRHKVSRRQSFERDVARAISNPVLRRAWIEWRLREEFDGSEFQRMVDNAIERFTDLPS